MHSQNPDAGLECAVPGLAQGRPLVSSVQNGRGTIYRPAALGSCLPKTHSLADVQADWPKARIRFPLPWSETRFRPSEDPNVHTADTNSRANCSRRTHSERLSEREKSRMGKGSNLLASLGEFLAITQQHNTASILNLSIPRLSKSDLWIGDRCTWYLGRWAEGATDLAGRPYVRNSHIALTKTILDYVGLVYVHLVQSSSWRRHVSHTLHSTAYSIGRPALSFRIVISQQRRWSCSLSWMSSIGNIFGDKWVGVGSADQWTI